MTAEGFCWQDQMLAQSLKVKRDNLMLFFQQKAPLNGAGLCLYDIPTCLRPVAAADSGRNLGWTNRPQHSLFKSNKNSFSGCCVSLGSQGQGPTAQPLLGEVCESCSLPPSSLCPEPALQHHKHRRLHGEGRYCLRHSAMGMGKGWVGGCCIYSQLYLFWQIHGTW